MKIAVSGATGFIGRHVLADLAARSLDTVALVRSAGEQSTSSLPSKAVELDIHQAPSNAFQMMGCPDVLIHLAWSGLPNYKSLHHFEQELQAQYAFIKLLIESGLKAVVVAGTCFEYGMQSGSLDEEIPARPSNPYGFAKNTLRCQLEYLKAIHPFQLTWGRLFYLYGEGQSENSLWPQLVQTAQRGEKFFNMSGGEQLRDYLPVSEVAGYLVSLALARKDIGVVNICSGKPVSVRSLVEGWIKENGWSLAPKFGHYAYPDYEPMAFWGDSKKLNLLIGENI